MKHMVTLALLLAPLGAAAQNRPAQGPMTVEIVSNGEVQVAAQRFRVSIKMTAKGKDNDAAATALAARRAKIGQLLAPLNVREAKATAQTSGTPSIMGVLTGIGNINKPSFTTEELEEDAKADPQAIATESVQYDAPSRAVIAQITTVAEANEATVDETVLPVLDDYVTPTRLAKADALKKAQAEADAYATALGLRVAGIVKISEKQDVVGGSMAFVQQLLGMFLPKGGNGSDTIPVQANLTVEFQLAR